MASSPGSFEQFVDAQVDDLLRVACVITWNEPDAEDLVQECLLRVAKHWPRVRTMDAPGAYARRVLVNLALDDGRRRSRRRVELERAVKSGRVKSEQVGDAGPIDPTASGAFEAFGERAELAAGLAALSAQQRTVLALRYFLDLSEAQVAELLGVSVGTVKSSASRGLARLRVVLGDEADASAPAAAPQINPSALPEVCDR